MSASDAVRAYGLLDEVELPIEVRLGSVELTLEEILRLGPGGIVPLGPVESEPVELAVAGLPFARGELVIVDGSFALRVSRVTGGPEDMGGSGSPGSPPAASGPGAAPTGTEGGTEPPGTPSPQPETGEGAAAASGPEEPPAPEGA